LVHIKIDVLVPVSILIKYQRGLFMFKLVYVIVLVVKKKL
jgi:hypothetical protein